LSGTYSELS